MNQLCPDCGASLFRWERLSCRLCATSDMNDFIDLLILGSIGYRTPKVWITFR